MMWKLHFVYMKFQIADVKMVSSNSVSPSYHPIPATRTSRGNKPALLTHHTIGRSQSQHPDIL